MHPLDWKSIRTLGGAQHKGFEELCAQIARGVVPPGCSFPRNGTPDGGVECCAIFASGEEWGWQAKYVHTLEESQWAQIDDSVGTALKTHPKLTRYHVCVPLDLPDARIQNRKSARDRWNEHKSKWSIWADELQMAVDFVWWGSSELLDMLSLPANAGRVLFWFGTPGCFDRPWFEAHIARATKSAGPRYTPELHVELPITQKFEALGRTARMIERVCGTGRKLREEYAWISGWKDCDENPGLGTACQPLKDAVDSLMELLDQFTERPCGRQGLSEICAAAKQALQFCYDAQRANDMLQYSSPDKGDEAGESNYRQNVEWQSQRRHSIRNFGYQLRSATQVYAAEEAFAESNLMVVTGEAGTGKTHLLCDLARHRVAEKRPTILLLGQSFTTTESPGRQVADLLQLPSASLPEIVGCLEAAAQAANARCLLMIDALNEGKGKQFWKPHLTEFLDVVRASPWLAVVLTVRTCYTDVVIPENVLSEAARATHQGFEEVAHEAVKSFFLAHELEFASVPVFSREFSNPLFLKTLCRGLQKSGYRTLPRGFHGITKVFDLYLEAMESELAVQLDFPRNQKLVRKALAALVRAATNANLPFLPIEQGREIVDRLLPGRSYSSSLCKALTDGGLLLESHSCGKDGTEIDVLCIAYERWSDHLAAKALLDEHLDSVRPSEAFKIGGPLAPYVQAVSMREGIREALSIQVPERVGRELLSLAPYALREWGMADAFLHSVVWRDPSACTAAMEALMHFFEVKKLAHNSDVWDARIAVATIPGHRLNMNVMDQWLQQTPMPDRDAAWTLSIHKAWDQEQSICHLVDWAWRLERGAVLEEESAWLAALTLSWCFTSSHRFLRDRATKALVNLLDDRLDVAARLVRHFTHVDDLYVMERVLASACGVAQRSHDKEKVAELADAVHKSVFSSGIPPTHILIRDYARCVIERAVYLGARLNFDPAVSQPPYRSIWPAIPSSDDIEKLKGQLLEREQAVRQIFYSVEYDDFARYVIGTDRWSNEWLSLSIHAPPWIPLSSKFDEVVETFTDWQKKLWRIINKLRESKNPFFDSFMALLGKDIPIPEGNPGAMRRKEARRNKRHSALSARLEESLPPGVKERLKELLEEQRMCHNDKPPYFDRSLIQRYIAKRVFDLGWTVDRFAWFDGTQVSNNGRDASKPERIGKKYQWIAYHEISALITDHFQYRENCSGMIPTEAYEGPWQDHFRDIDPTHVIKSLPESAGTREAWWETIRYDNWQGERGGCEWATDASDFPELSRLLQIVDPHGGRWINTQGFYMWERERPPSQGYEGAERRSLWAHCHAWLVKREDVPSLLYCSTSVDVGNQWMPHQLPHVPSVFLGEYSWAQASQFHEDVYYDGWHEPSGCQVKVFSIPAEYLDERGSFDCSMDEGFTLLLPTPGFVRDLELRWTGKGADFVTPAGDLFATDPRAYEPGRHCLLLREDLLWKYLDDNDLSLVWLVRGGKERYGPRNDYESYFGLKFSGVLQLTRGGVVGEVHHEDLKKALSK